MGKVYKAFDERLGRWVAAKRLRGEASPRARERFRREARTLAQLGHPGIVQIFDIVEGDTGDWIVMELVDGPTLAELRRSGPLDVGLALDYGRQMASALEAAHARGIVHRDLKTENVMVLPSGHVKVLDFGLARRVKGASVEGSDPFAGPGAELSRTGGIAGTPRSMSPEQAAGRKVDPRSDLFCLGVLLFEILTARLPFAARSVAETLRRILLHSPPSARELNPKVPRELADLVERLLEKDPCHRPQTATDVMAGLAAIGPGVYESSTDGSDEQDLALAATLKENARSVGAFLDAPTVENPTAESVAAPRGGAVVTTLLVSRLVGSAELLEKLGDSAAVALFRRHDQLARGLLERHDGREVEKSDGFLLLFERPWNAVSYAFDYHEGLSELGLAARVGIHLGEVILHRNTPDDVKLGAKPIEVEGLSRHTASRLMSLAVGGQTLVTPAVHDVARRSAVSERSGLEWRLHGRYRFRAGDETEVFEVGVPGKAPFVAPAGSAKIWRLDAGGEGESAGTVYLRSWPALELPEQPYPVLLPYTHPDFLAGRDQEIARMRRLLETPVPILGLPAPSGAGKSSLLVGGLVPILRAEGVPVALLRHPTEPGLVSKLINDLLEGVDPVDDGDVVLGDNGDLSAFVERLEEAERLSGKTPILVVDQADDLFRDGAAAARAVLGTLMAASVAHRPGLGAPPCRWVIAYREELSGRLNVWLEDVLAVGAHGLPRDLSGPERFQILPLPPLATPSAGAEEPLGESTEVFLAAIEKPLEGGDFPWFFPPHHAERLARAFAETRIACPDAPLAPELQVTLAHLLAEAGPDGRLHVPVDPGSLIAEALDHHLRRALETVFPATDAVSATQRARALLALRELAASIGERNEGLRPEELAQGIGEDGEEVLERLSRPWTRLVVVRETADGPRWVLAHDRVAEAVVRLVKEEGRHGQLAVDAELLALRRLVTLRTALYRSREVATATQVPRRAFRRIEENAEALLRGDERRAWWVACRARRRHDQRRFTGIAALVVLAFAGVGWGAWTWARRLAEHRALLEQAAEARPDVAFRALDELATRPDADAEELLALVRRRQAPMDVLGRGLGGLDGPRRSVAVLRAVESALAWVEETPEDPVLLANLVWALDFAPGRDPLFAERARAMRDRVLEPLHRRRPPPPLPDPDDPDWIHVPAGRFLMGTGAGGEGYEDERPQHEVTVSAFRIPRHEVTNAEYRRLVPEHDPTAADEMPAAFITWHAAYTYAAWLGGRLPTEAEWEYAARAGCPHAYCDRNGQETTVDAVAWTLRNSLDAVTGELAPQPVMRLEPNPWGIYDMLGNLWEWVADWYGEYPDRPQSDPWGPPSPGGGRRVFRGGGFRQGSDWARTAHRIWFAAGDEIDHQGFRVAIPSPRGE